MENLQNNFNMVPSRNEVAERGSEDKNDYRLLVLNENNYPGWKFQIKLALESKGLWKYVEDPLQSGDPRAKQAATILTSTLSYDNLMKVINCQTAHEMWLALGCIYENRCSSEKQVLLSKFHGFRIKSVRDLSKSLGELQAMAARLKALGASIDDDTIMSIILNALPEGFNLFKTSWSLFNADQKSLNKLISCVLVEAANMKAPEERALVAQETTAEANKSLQYNNKNSETERKPFNSRRAGYTRDKRNDTCNFCKKTGHWARDCLKLKKKNENKGGVAFMAIDNHLKVKKTTWIADSGCSMHMTPHKDWLLDYRQLDEAIGIRLGDNKVIDAIGVGRIVISTGTIHNVYYVPGIGSNLFSLSSAAEMGNQITIEKDTLTISQGQETIIVAPKIQGVYLLDFDIYKQESAMMAATIGDWHERLGHPSVEVINRMARNNVVQDLRVKGGENDFRCVACTTNKCSRVGHPLRSSTRASKPGLTLHMDTAGPMSLESIGGARYFLLVKDEFSTYKIVRPVASKSNLPDEVKRVISITELETGNKVLRIVSDNGSEFKNHSLSNFLQERGIDQRFAVTYTPQQNGFIEREIRTVTECARTLLNRAKLTQELWAEMVSTAVYLLNRVINSRTGDKTPYELWHGKKPSVKNLHKVGSEAILLTPEGRTKFAEKGEKLIFIGYTDVFNTFRFFDPESKQVLIACDAVFIEGGGDNSSSYSTYDGLKVPEIVEKETDSYTEGLINFEEEVEATDGDVSFKTAEESNTSLDETIIDLNSPNSDENKRSKVDNIKSMLKNVPKNLMVRNKPPEILEKRLRSGNPRHYANLSTIEASEDPKSYKEAMTRSDKDKWTEAMKEEISSLKKNQVWVLVDRPENNIVTNKWVLKIKRKPNGEVERYKARLVARGFTQIQGIDYTETYAPVADMTSIRMLFAYAAIERLKIAQFDVKTAFLYGTLDETVYMEQPEGFCEDPHKVCLLKRSLYGLKQSPRQWNQKFSNFLKDMKLIVSDNDNCVFYRHKPLLIIAIYVDDGIVFAHDQNEIEDAIQQLSNRFEIHRVESTTFLGFQYHRGIDGSITIHQDSYVKTILKKFRMEEAKPAEAPVTLTKPTEINDTLDKETPYREAVGSLMYAAVTTRLDISYAVNKVSRCVVNPTSNDWKSVKHIMRYLRDKENLGITYSSNKNEGLIVYCDSDFAGDPSNSRSTTGYVFMYGGAPVLWKSQRQSLITLSSTEAEFVSLCSTVKTLIWLRRFAKEIRMIDDTPTKLLCDNQSAIRIATNEKCVHRTRHMSVQASFPREQMEKGEVAIEHIKSDDQLADILTKPTTSAKFKLNRDKMMNKNYKLMGLTAIAMLALVINIVRAFVFQRIDPMIWIPTDDMVDIGFVTYQYDFVFTNPCEMVPETLSNSTHTIGMPLYTQLYMDCMSIYKDRWLDKVQELIDTKPPKRVQGHTIQKREIITLSGLAVVGLVTFSNFIVNIVKSNSIEFEVDGLRKKNEKHWDHIMKQAMKSNATYEAQMKMFDELHKLESLVYANRKDIAFLTASMPKVSWITNVVFGKITEKYGYMNSIIGKLSEGMIATRELGLLMNTTNLRGTDPKDTVAQTISRPYPDTIRFNFIAREKSKDTKVYQVVPINHWSNLTGTPFYMEYIGSEYLIYNSTSNCAKAIRQPSSRIVQEECNEQDWHDPKLNIWRKNYDAFQQKEHYDKPVFIRSFEWNYFYCYDKNLTTSGKTLECPTYPFRLPISTPVKLDYINYHPKAYRTVITEKLQVIDTMPFTVYPTTIDSEELNMLKRLNETKQDLMDAQHKLTTSIYFESENTFYWTKITTGLIIAAIALLFIYILITLNRNNQARLRNSPQELQQPRPVGPEQENHLLNHAYQIPNFAELQRAQTAHMNTFGNQTAR